ncbi:hypothetical protein DPMN_015588 [Dreissena polymorpha]|uniref:Uncharacterized protein n=1 Tax=Dreissena polymorpha TaxID=45954 RepID=A0A9D4ND35_DREPO|nr:hypothetical protein DPMN_015588 [Dreissena polymorpha]
MVTSRVLTAHRVNTFFVTLGNQPGPLEINGLGSHALEDSQAWEFLTSRVHKEQYQFEVNLCRNEEIIVKGNFGWAWPMWAGRPRIDRIVIKEVQYKIEVNHCRYEEIIVKGNFGWVWPMWAGRPRVGNGPCIVEIDRIVILREVQYQFEDNRCRNEEIIFQGSSAYSVGGDRVQDGQTNRRRR